MPERSQVSESLESTEEFALQPRDQERALPESSQTAEPQGKSDESSAEKAVSPPPSQVQGQIPDRPYTIQVAAYAANSSRGLRLLERLRERDETAFMAPVNAGQKRLVRLLIGSFASWDDAFEHARTLEARGVFDEFAITRMPYAVELEAPTDAARVERILAQLGERSRFAYAQEGPGPSVRLLAGAFETREAAQAFADELGVNGKPLRVVSR